MDGFAVIYRGIQFEHYFRKGEPQTAPLPRMCHGCSSEISIRFWSGSRR
jgi:hypothetical protein